MHAPMDFVTRPLATISIAGRGFVWTESVCLAPASGYSALKTRLVRLLIVTRWTARSPAPKARYAWKACARRPCVSELLVLPRCFAMQAFVSACPIARTESAARIRYADIAAEIVRPRNNARTASASASPIAPTGSAARIRYADKAAEIVRPRSNARTACASASPIARTGSAAQTRYADKAAAIVHQRKPATTGHANAFQYAPRTTCAAVTNNPSSAAPLTAALGLWWTPARPAKAASKEPAF